MKKLRLRKQQIQNLKAPTNMEERLLQTLQKQPKKKSRNPIWFAAIAAIFLVMLTYNFNAFAYYGKKLFGYDMLMTESLKILNEDGLGQSIQQSLHLTDGTILTIEGVVSDTNRFVVYYRLKNEAFPLTENFQFEKIDGFLTNSFFSSSTSIDDENQFERTSLATFDAVNPFAKKLTISMRDEQQEFTMTIPYNSNAAIPTTLKRPVHHTFKTDIGDIKLKKLTSTAASTVLEGKFHKETERNIRIPMDLKLFADGKEIPVQQGGLHSGFPSIYSFKLLYDAIPPNTKKLEIVLDQFNGYEIVDEMFEVKNEAQYHVGPEMLKILNYEQKDGYTYIKIASNYDVLFNGVYLITENGKVRLQTTTGFNDQTDEWIRTLVFETSNIPEKLLIDGVYYLKTYNQSFEVEIKSK